MRPRQQAAGLHLQQQSVIAHQRGAPVDQGERQAGLAAAGRPSIKSARSPMATAVA
jgi:hypothetical protein